MMGPIITQDSIDKSPWWFRILFYTMCYGYLVISAVVAVAFIPVAAVREAVRAIRNR